MHNIVVKYLVCFVISSSLSLNFLVMFIAACSWDCNTRKRRVICKYKSDPTVALGYLSFALLVASSVADFLSLFYPYQGKSIPQAALLKNTSFVVVLNIAL